MRFSLLLTALFISGISHVRAAWTVVDRVARPSPAGLEFSECKVTDATNRATIWTVTFQPKSHTFSVMDNPDGAFDLGSASEKRGALAAVNGGYFHPNRTPLGLVVRQGALIHPLERAKLLSGIVSTTSTSIAIQRTGAFKLTPAVRAALQAGPFLVEGGKAIKGLDAGRSAARTVVFQDARGRSGLLVCKSTSLAETAAILATPEIFPAGKILRALNLDGGSSTALWVRGSPPFYAREWKGVRNYLAIVER